MINPVHRLLVAAALFLVGVLATSAAGAQTSYDFNLPQQPLADTLRDIGRLTAMNILFEPESVENKTAPAVRGRFSAKDAVNHVLAGTKLASQQTAANTMLVRSLDRESADAKKARSQTGEKQTSETTSGPVASYPRLRFAQAQGAQGSRPGQSSSTGADAQAQADRTGANAPEDPSGLPVVVITVERVVQSLQSYEGTAVAVSQNDLDVLGAGDLLDLPTLMPGVEITNYESNTEIYVRGIGSNANTELGDPAVAPHLDDVYVPRPRGLGVAFFDLERVEVNVGPQGTVRGRNALGGSVNVISRKPVLNEFQGYAEFSVGDFDQQELRGALNVPLGEIAATRLAVYSSKHDPYVENTGPLNNLLGLGITG